MSIVDSTQELDEAKARLADATADQLSEDLRFWAVATLDAQADHVALADQQTAVIRRFQEAQHWTSLIAAELRARRDTRLGCRPPADEGGV